MKYQLSRFGYSRKKMIMLVSLTTKSMLTTGSVSLSERNRHYRDFTLISLTFAIREVIACLSVYRTYADATRGEISERDRKFIEAAVDEAKKRNPRTARAIFDFIGDTLALENLARFRAEDRHAVVDFVMKFQQLTGPVMAKGVEDTAFYVYNRLISLNEVGGDPDEFGISLEVFHGHNEARLKLWPHTMLTLSTHDTKRGEDGRSRIDALSEIAPEWRAALSRWRQFNEVHKTLAGGEAVPDRNDEYLFYQTLVGAWPAGGFDEKELAPFRDRIVAYLEKAVKEAKVHTSLGQSQRGLRPRGGKIRAGSSGPGQSDGFLNDFSEFQKPIAFAGMLNSLAQTLLKMTAPGVPDFYQGTELWDLSLVDPDNRRPVDFAKRRESSRRTRSGGAGRSRRHGVRPAFALARWPRQALSDPEDFELSPPPQRVISDRRLLAALRGGKIPRTCLRLRPAPGRQMGYCRCATLDEASRWLQLFAAGRQGVAAGKTRPAHRCAG